MDADRRLVVQGQRNVKWRVVQQAWHKSTGLRTGIPALRLRQARLVSIIGNEAMLHSHSYIDSGEESEGEPPSAQTAPSEYANVRTVRKHLGFPLSWEQASKADKKLVAMKEKGHKWSTISEEFQRSIHRHMRPCTCKSRFHQLVELRDRAYPSPTALLVKSDEKDNKGKDEQEIQSKAKDSQGHNIYAGDLDDGVSVYSVSDDSSEDEGPLSMLRFRRTPQEADKDRVQMDQSSKGHTATQNGGRIVPDAGETPATDPEKMVAAMQEGEKRWPKIREAWENAKKRKTPTNDIAKQDSDLLNGDEVSIGMMFNCRVS